MSVIEKEKPRVEYSQINGTSFPAVPSHNPVGVVAQESLQDRVIPVTLSQPSLCSYPPQLSSQTPEKIQDLQLFATPPPSSYESKFAPDEGASALQIPPPDYASAIVQKESDHVFIESSSSSAPPLQLSASTTKHRHRMRIKKEDPLIDDSQDGKTLQKSSIATPKVLRSTEIECGEKMYKAITKGDIVKLKQLCKECPSAVNELYDDGSLMRHACVKGRQFAEVLLKTERVILSKDDSILDPEEYSAGVWQLLLSHTKKLSDDIIRDVLEKAIEKCDIELTALFIHEFPSVNEQYYELLARNIYIVAGSKNSKRLKLFIVKLIERGDLDPSQLIMVLIKKNVMKGYSTWSSYDEDIIEELSLNGDLNCKSIIQTALSDFDVKLFDKHLLSRLLLFFEILGIDRAEVEQAYEELKTEKISAKELKTEKISAKELKTEKISAKKRNANCSIQ